MPLSSIPQIKAEFFKTLGHPLRIRVFELLAAGEQSVGDLQSALGVEQPQLSQQLGVLRRAGLVVARRAGTNVFYELADQRVVELLDIAKQILLERLTATRDELRAS